MLYDVLLIIKLKTMKLELKHLAPYLPYRLKYYHLILKCTEIVIGFEEYQNNDRGEGQTVRFKGYCADLDDPSFKPILRPLSDLTDRINPVQHYTYLDGLNHNSIEKIQDLIMKGILYLEDYNYLIEHHFDIFGLIDKGLAVDINTLSE